MDHATYILLENATALGECRLLHRPGFVLCQFIERQPSRLNECQQYKTAYDRTRLHSPNALAFSSFQLFPNVSFDPQ